ncbi:GntR family transcriptional regulator [Verrucomicrobium spinosum]|uniref:GntR family transcriptional regulator n=1 Tax=Verrucomicrobium spinosum TaxID=2736 RepID=UPI0001746A5B|nr:GntR family transcriptional regulator [Verrucomicrobium spinosum]
MNTDPATPRRNLASEIASLLRGDIISGTLKPGEALAEPVLAKRFGVSRAPVREAFIELERAGLVQFENTGRTRVRTLEESDVVEIIEARIALESMGARLAALKWKKKDTRWIESSIANQEKAASSVEFSKLDIAMHEYIMKCAGNKRLVVLWEYVRWQFEMALTHIHRMQGKHAYDLRRFTVTGHWNVLESLESGEPEAAAKIMTRHITGSLEWSIPSTPEEPFVLPPSTTKVKNPPSSSLISSKRPSARRARTSRPPASE